MTNRTPDDTSPPPLAGHAADRRGYVYVLSNPSMPGIVKIGRSRHGGRGRADSLYKNDTGVPEPFVLEFEMMVDDAPTIEFEVHEACTSLRVSPQREFFRLSPADARHSILECVLKGEDWFPDPCPRIYVDIGYEQASVRSPAAALVPASLPPLDADAFSRTVRHMARDAGRVSLAYVDLCNAEAAREARRRLRRERPLAYLFHLGYAVKVDDAGEIVVFPSPTNLMRAWISTARETIKREWRDAASDTEDFDAAAYAATAISRARACPDVQS